MRILLSIIMLSCASAFGVTTNYWNGTDTQLQSLINANSAGDIIQATGAPKVVWTTGVTCSKGLSILGTGSYKHIGDSKTSVTLGTGTKTFTTQSGLSWTNNQLIRAVYTPMGGAIWNQFNTGTNMLGTVQSYSGSSLQINVTTANGTAGNYGAWAFIYNDTNLTTEVYLNVGTNSNGITLTQDTADFLELANIHFLTLPGYMGVGFHIVRETGVTGGKAVLLHDVGFSMQGNEDGAIRWENNSGVLWEIDMNSAYEGISRDGTGHSADYEGIQFKALGDTTSWARSDTMGQNDTTGFGNVYLEDSRFYGIKLQAWDSDEYARIVCRYERLVNSGVTSHGRDTGAGGSRHMEYYNITTIFNDVGADSYPMDYQFFVRGGTAIFATNSIDNIASSQWGDKTEIKFQDQAIQRACANDCCWNSGWPSPRQIGQSFNGTAMFNDPVYFWANSGTLGQGVVDYDTSACGGSPPLMSVYVKPGREWTNDVKVGWVAFPYPHPARAYARSGGGGGGGNPAAGRGGRFRGLRLALSFVTLLACMRRYNELHSN